MPIAFGSRVANNSQSAAQNLFAGTLAVSTGDLLLAVVTWSTTDATPTFTDTQGNTWTTLTKRKHPNVNRWVQAAYAWNATANASDSQFVDMGVNVTAWSFSVARYTGAKTSATPFVAQNWGSANSATDVTAGNVDPGADGMVWAAVANDSGYRSGTAGSGFTKAGPDFDFGFTQHRIVTGAGNVAASGSFNGADNLVIVSAAFLSASGSSDQRIRVESQGSGMQLATGIGGYVWNSTGTSRLTTFSNLTAQAALNGGNSVLFIDANGLGLSNGTSVLVALANSTHGGVYLANGTVEAGAA